ncbi:MAG TPA: hypothetical protein VIX73_22580 [Kofleriaceae bacterium]|jgi:ElaB/YqjD/DUF883 family membrane-anchored ribosome-binding protein
MNKNGMTDVGAGIDEKLDSLKHTVKDVVDQGAQRAEALKTKFVEVKDAAKRRGGDAIDRVSSLIQAHPLKAIAIAFATGYIGMRLFRR